MGGWDWMVGIEVFAIQRITFAIDAACKYR
jgi:hypothetical protein